MKNVLKLFFFCCLSCIPGLAIAAGVVVGWGNNLSGEATGIPSNPGSGPAVGVVVLNGEPLTNATAVIASSGVSFALRKDGTVVGWGDNQAGRAIGRQTQSPYRTNGTVMVDNQIVGNISAIASGGNFGMGLTRDGTFVSWGDNAVPASLSNLVAISACGGNALVVRRDGTVAGWKTAPWNPKRGQLYSVEALSNVTAVSVGGNGNVEWNTALRSNGSVFAWRPDSSDPVALPERMTNISSIASGLLHTIALKKDGTVFGFGFNGDGAVTGVPTRQSPSDPTLSGGPIIINGQPLSNIVAVSAYGRYNLALKNDGTVIAWGEKRFVPQVPSGLSNVVAISAGDGYCLAISTNIDPRNLALPTDAAK